MAGLNFNISVDDLQVREALNELIQRGGTLRPALALIGEHLIDVHEARFAAQIGSDGRPWTPLSEEYRRRKPRQQNMILVLNSHLANSFRWQATDEVLEFGTDRKYAALHHFGFFGQMQVSAHSRRTKSGKITQVRAHSRQMNIPARPFMGIAESDEEPVRIIADFLLSRGA